MYFALVINEKAPSNVFGFGIGAVIAIAHLCVGNFSGACLNPIRFIGPALLTDKIKYLTIYVTSHFCGGLLAGFYYEFYLNAKKDEKGST